MDQPLVTIAIPTHNRADTYLPTALRCALAQTYPRLEIIVSDNASTDGTRDLIARHRDERLRYLRHDVAMSPNDNFNYCIQQARGDYLLLLLDDEQIDRDFVQTCVEAAAGRTGIGLVRTGLRTIDANGTVIAESPNDAAGLTLGDFFLAWFAGRTALYLCNTLFNTGALRAAGGLHSRHCLFQDVMAQVKLLARYTRCDVGVIKASTRSHRGQFTYGGKVRAWAEDSLELLELICQTVPPERRDHVRREGTRFFAMISYSRANAIRSAAERLQVYTEVYRIFGNRYLPTPRMVLSSTSIYRHLRNVKRRIKGQPRWAAAG